MEIDIEKCFDRISHQSILGQIIAPTFLKRGLNRCLKAGINPEFPEQGTSQGGVISPLLANIGLNGIESLGNGIRYADDMVFILKPEDNADELLKKINNFLEARGMNISQKKTKVAASTDGFDFLGWHFVVGNKNGKFRCTPSEENYQSFRHKVKHIVNNSNYGAQEKARKLAPIVRGWRSYHKYCRISGSRFSLWRLSYRTFKVFLKQKSINRHEAERPVKIALPAIGYGENKFVNVKSDKSPFDGDLVYWAKRNSTKYDNRTAKALQRQNHSCAHCGLLFSDGEKVHRHHRDGNNSNWKSNNLGLTH